MIMLRISQFKPLISQQILSLQELLKIYTVHHLQWKKIKNLYMPFTLSFLYQIHKRLIKISPNKQEMHLTLRGYLMTQLKTYIKKPAIINLKTLLKKRLPQSIIVLFQQNRSLILIINLIIVSRNQVEHMMLDYIGRIYLLHPS